MSAPAVRPASRVVRGLFGCSDSTYGWKSFGARAATAWPRHLTLAAIKKSYGARRGVAGTHLQTSCRCPVRPATREQELCPVEDRTHRRDEMEKATSTYQSAGRDLGELRALRKAGMEPIFRCAHARTSRSGRSCESRDAARDLRGAWRSGA